MTTLFLVHPTCSTCKKAKAWLDQHRVKYTLRSIVEEPPTLQELSVWIPKSGKGIRKWLNTSGMSYRAIGREKIAEASDVQLGEWLCQDGKLVKRPVLVHAARVLVGFKEEEYTDLFGK